MIVGIPPKRPITDIIETRKAIVATTRENANAKSTGLSCAGSLFLI